VFVLRVDLIVGGGELSCVGAASGSPFLFSKEKVKQCGEERSRKMRIGDEQRREKREES